MLRFAKADENSHYLGLPNITGRKKSVMLGYLKEKVKDKFQSWNGKILTKGGKEILVRLSLKQSRIMPCQFFLLPLEMCKDMENIMCKFWRISSIKEDKSIHWMSWDRMCRPKSVGGLGFRHMHDFNIVLLGKQGWKLLTKSDSLMAKVYKARYYPYYNFLSTKVGGSPSLV